jgi:hypothetical protein
MASSDPKADEPKSDPPSAGQPESGNTGAKPEGTGTVAAPTSWVPASHALKALLVLVLWRYALPVHPGLVDVAALGLCVALLASAIGVSLRATWGFRFARVVAIATLAFGALFTGALLLSILYLLGVHNPLAPGGIVLFAAIALFIAPYMIILPGLELRALRQATASSPVHAARVDSELDQ